jgi:hypothetical protein
MTAVWERKVDSRLRALIAAASDPMRTVTVFVRFDGDPRGLADFGLQVGNAAGDVSAGLVALGDVPRLASAPQVRVVELTRVIPADAR